MPNVGEGTIKLNRYVLVDYGKFLADTSAKQRELKRKDGMTEHERLANAGLGQAAISNVKNMYDRSGSEWVREWASNYILPEIAGCVNKNTYKGICDLFGLNPEKYLLKEKPKQEEIAIKKVPAKPDVSNATIIDKLDELIMAINKLGNIEMQNMEYLKALTKK